MDIRFVPYSAIDPVRWNQCIRTSLNGLIYGRTEYLNTFCPQWDALILGDYEAVMPLTSGKKWGIRYLYQPAFTQQLGVFGRSDTHIQQAFLQEARKRFRFAEIHLNFIHQDATTTRKHNQIIDLHKPYPELKKNYSDYTLRKLKQAGAATTSYREISAAQNILAYQQLFGPQTPHVPSSVYDRLNRFCLQYPELCLSRGLFLEDSLIASVTALRDEQRIYLITLTAHERKHYPWANHQLIDQLILEHAQQALLLDFEGSDLEGVFAFNAGFGAVDQPYLFCKWNDLPWPVRLLKK